MSPTWSALPISPDEDFDGAPLLRCEFVLDEGHGPVARATLYATAHGVFEAYLNGRPVSGDVLSPGWSSYEWRLRYRTYDVTPLLRPTSVLGLALGNGWFRGRLTWSGGSAFYGNELAALAQLEIEFADGYVQTVVSDESWSAGPSAVVSNDLYDGQTIDARRESHAWLQPGFSDSWTGVHQSKLDFTTLTPYIGPPVRRQEELQPIEIWTSPAGKTLVDFGQNLVGWLRARVQGPAGSTITLRHAEVLEHDELGTRPLRTAKATDHFILSGGEDVFEPTFTFHGFRYVEVDGWPGELTTDAITAVVVSSQLQRIGEFECSDELLNQLHRNVVWGTRGNFLDVPTDCPQRDERLGWTGDIAVFAPSAAYLFDVEDFLREWLANLAAEQRAAEGMVGYVVPDVLKYVKHPSHFPPPESTAIWSDAAVWVPWALWRAYGNLQVLRDQFDSMIAHVQRVESLLSPSGLWDTGFQFGDWLDPTTPPDQPAASKADNGVVATACLYRDARILEETAALLQRGEDERQFADLAERTRTAFNEHYVHDDGTIRSDAQTVYALALVFGLLDEDTDQLAGKRLAELVAESGYRIQTGFAGTPYVLDALSATGHLDEAYRLLLQRECPSWLYTVSMGATTIWERWDSMLPDGTINPGEMTSFNHYALGAVADWMHRSIGGIAPLEPGYSRVLIAPQPGGDIHWARSSLETKHGKISASWSKDSGGPIELDIAVPEGVTALVQLPGSDTAELGSGQHHVSSTPV
jgi:alpha-L-rhamnosidase